MLKAARRDAIGPGAPLRCRDISNFRLRAKQQSMRRSNRPRRTDREPISIAIGPMIE